MRRGVRTSTCAAVLAIAAAAPAGAGAAPGTVTDTDFTRGTSEGSAAVVAGGVGLVLGGTRYEFDGGTLPPGWESATWDTGGTATVSGGALTVSGARAYETAPGSAGQVLEFNATFGGSDFQNAGFADDFEAPLWAAFSTGGDALATGLWARTRRDGSAPGTNVAAPAGVVPTVAHTYRIEWAAATVRFSVDGAPVNPPQPLTLAPPMRPVISDYDPLGTSVSVDWLQLGSYGSGTFTSRVLDTGDTRAAWGALTAVSAGSQIEFATRTGNSDTPDASWTGFEPVGAGGAVVSRGGRYIQYRATLAAADPTVSPLLEQVEIGYDVDDVGPRTVIDGVDVAGSNASVRFSSPDADVAGFACGIDSGAVAACTSPKSFGDLAAGAHSVAVVAIDRAGNAGSPVSRAFAIAAPPGPPAPPPRVGVAVRLYHQLVRASRAGTVKLRVGCTQGERACTVRVRLQRGRRAVGQKIVQIPSGDSRIVTLRLPKGVRRALARRGKLKLTVTLSARDAAGSTKTLRRTVTVSRPR